jgi:hypothetical protein
MKIVIFLDFYFLFILFYFYFCGLSNHFSRIISKTSTLSNENKITKGIQSLLTLILQGAKRALFFTLNAIILQSIYSTFLENISTHFFNSLRQDPMVGYQEKNKFI